HCSALQRPRAHRPAQQTGQGRSRDPAFLATVSLFLGILGAHFLCGTIYYNNQVRASALPKSVSDETTAFALCLSHTAPGSLRFAAPEIVKPYCRPANAPCAVARSRSSLSLAASGPCVRDSVTAGQCARTRDYHEQDHLRREPPVHHHLRRPPQLV